MPLHARQFLLGPHALKVQADWLSTDLPGGWHLSYSPTLPLRSTAAGLVLGIAIPTEGPGDDDDAWAGRWIRIGGGRVRTDAGALLGCFHRRIDKESWLSSSAEILRRLEPEQPLARERLSRGRRVMDWYPPPLSGVEGIHRLLPSQAFRLDDGLIEAADVPIVDGDEDLGLVLERVADRLVAAVKGAAAVAEASGGTLWVALTSGQDSRLVLAAAVAAQVEATAFTFHSPRTPEGDRDLPPRLASAVGMDHLAIAVDAADPEREQLYDMHTAYHHVGAARFQYSAFGWDRLPESAISLEGGCFELGRAYYYDRLPRELASTPEEVVEAIMERFPSPHSTGVQAWATWILGAGREERIDWRDRFYLEQRIAGWLSSNAQGVDLSGRQQVHIANCRALMSDLLRVPPQLRRRGAHHRELIARLAPALVPFPLAEKPRHRGRRDPGRRPLASLIGDLRDRGSRLARRTPRHRPGHRDT